MRPADLTDEARAAAMAPWDREGGQARRGRATLYRDPGLEMVFTLAPPWLPHATMGPIALLAIGSGLGAVPLWKVPLELAGGALVWSLVEYLMHRFLFHARAESEGARVVLLLVHGHHHLWPDDPRRVAATPIQFGSLALLFYGVLSLVLAAPDARVTFGGAMIGYLLYEASHWLAHHGRAQSGVLGALKRHHMRHHHEDPRSRWGIGTPLWDHMFRTAGAADASPDASPDVAPPHAPSKETRP